MSHTRERNRQRSLLAPAICLSFALLAGCGGGGGDATDDPGSGSPPTGTAESNIPLRIVQGNELPAIQVPTIYAESLLALAHDVDQWTREFAGAPQSTLSRSCPQGGGLTFTWSDVNGDARLGVGDTLRLDLVDCAAPASNSRFSGSIQVSVVSPSVANAIALQVRITPSGLRFAAGPLTATWAGSFRTERLLGARRDQLAMQASAIDQLRLEFSGAGVSAVDRIETVGVSRDADADLHGTTSTFAVSLASDVLQGRVSLSTPTPLFAHFDTFPTRGALEAAGDGRVRVQSGQGTRTAWLSVLEGAATGGGFTVHWTEMMAGLAWVGAGALPDQYAAVEELSAVPFDFVGSVSTTSIDPWLRRAAWQVNRELQTSTTISAARLTRVGAGWGPDTVDASIEIRGGHLRLSWTEQLEPGAIYNVAWLSGDPLQPVLLRSIDGQWLQVQATLAVSDALQASIVAPGSPLLLPGGDARLDGSFSKAVGSSIVSHRWRQLSGIPVVLSTPDQAATAVSLAAAPGAATSEVVLELLVTDARGVMDSQTVTLVGVPSPATSTLAQMRGSSGDPLLDGRHVYTAWSAPSQIRWDDGNPTNFLRIPLSFESPVGSVWLYFSLPLGTPLQSGTYQAPVSLSQRVDTAAMDILMSNGPCEQPNGTFTIHEVQLAPPDGSVDGTPVANLALDFTVSCAGLPPVTGSVRQGSAIPLSP